MSITKGAPGSDISDQTTISVDSPSTAGQRVGQRDMAVPLWKGSIRHDMTARFASGRVPAMQGTCPIHPRYCLH